MQINWPLVIVLFCMALPGVLIAIPRLITLLLPDNSEELKQRISRLAVAQTLVMVLLMSFAGSILSLRTGLNSPILEALLQGKSVFSSVQQILLPTLLFSLGGLIIFFVLYYGLVSSILDEKTFMAMKKMRTSLRLDGCVLYGGVVEEIITRWGLMNVIAFFAIIFTGHKSPAVIWTAIFFSGILLCLGQFPAYIAAGCKPSRRFIYSMFLLNSWQAILFGWIFWQYGLLAAIAAHMLFHLLWALYDKA